MNPKRITITMVLFFIMLILIAGGLISCSIVHKLKASTHEKVDSTATKNTEQVQLQKKDSTGYYQQDSVYSETLTLNFDTALFYQLPIDPVGTIIPQDPENDYEAAAVKPLQAVYRYNIAGSIVRSPVPIKTAVLARNGHTAVVNLVHTNAADSNHSAAAETAHVVTTKDHTEKNKTSRHAPIVFSRLLLLLAAAAAWYALKRYKII